MSLVLFIFGIMIKSRGDVPPAIMGGSVKHTVSDQTANIIAWLLIIPFVMDVLRLCGLRTMLPYPLLVLYILTSNTLPLAAVILYYINRHPRPAYGDPPY